YHLGPLTPGVYWGHGLSSHFQGNGMELFQIPLAIRYGISRQEYSRWSIDGCIGIPFGSLLVKKAAGHCRDAGYRQLLYNGLPGDPPAGTPVTMFPDCKRMENIFDPTAGCFTD